MTLTVSGARSLCATLLGTALISTLAAAPAYAGSRNPAPIVYHGQQATQQYSQPAPMGAPQPQRGDLQSRGYSSPPAPAGKAGKRIEFRYPDQPQTIYGNGAARQSADKGPIVFSSSDAAIAPEKARQYASVQTPQMSIPQPAHDPAITAGGFDARAAASAISNNRAGEVMRSEALPALQPAPQPTPMEATQPSMFDETGIAIVYTSDFIGTQTANGEIYDPQGMTAAHPTLPLPSLVHVVNPLTQQEVVVRVNDRGPFEAGANLQLSEKAAAVIGLDGAGQSNVQIRYLGEAPVLAAEAAPYAPAPAAQLEPELAGYSQVTAPVQPANLPPASYVQAQNYAGNVYVQLGAFSDIGNAEYLRDQLGANLDVEVSHAVVNGSDFFRVRVGPYNSTTDAERTRNYISAQGIANGRIVRD